MNLILLEPPDFVAGDRVRLDGRRLRHVRDVHRAAPGDELAVGVLGGRVGTGTVERVAADALEMSVRLDADPPPKLALSVLLALPRPKVLARVVQDLTSLGVQRIVLLNAWRVEKAYWASPAVEPASLRAACVLGLEQARDTVLPELRIERFFAPFVHETLAGWAPDAARFVAHPGAADGARRAPGPALLAVGPEGGWIERELDSFRREGFEEIGLGPRPLRVETAVTALVARLT